VLRVDKGELCTKRDGLDKDSEFDEVAVTPDQARHRKHHAVVAIYAYIACEQHDTIHSHTELYAKTSAIEFSLCNRGA
jgi:hypothetical protein